MKLKDRILKEMVITSPKEKIKLRIWKEIGYRYKDNVEFDKAFQKAYRKITKELKQNLGIEDG